MLKVVEAFSGIGSQVQALKNIGISYEIAATIEWDINAIYAYDIIHNGPQDISSLSEISKSEAIDKLLSLGISADGKEPATKSTLRTLSEDSLRRFLYAIERTHNLVNITKIHATDLPSKIDVLTYSFPCQDLSVCGSWHGNMSGINKEVKNRSGMLWEVERILEEYKADGIKFPRFLLMENVSNILSHVHYGNFKEWENTLSKLGYVNQIYTLNALNFGVPQQRVRTFMLSVHCKDEIKRKKIKKYFAKHNLENFRTKELPLVSDFLRVDYTNPKYKYEADESNPQYTPSRQRIHEDNDIIFDGKSALSTSIKTITTKQDRNPNSGLVLYDGGIAGKAPYRNITPRECFLFMGFDEKSFDVLMEHNCEVKKGRKIFSREKLIKLAGNSIVVNVLEEVFKQVLHIKNNILYSKMNE